MKLTFFHAPWCGVCHDKSPLVERIAAEAGLPLERWNIDDPAGAEQAELRRIRMVPTLALVDGERVRFRLIGREISPENARFLLDRFAV